MGIPPRDWYHRIEEGLFYKGAVSAQKFTNLGPLPVASKTADIWLCRDKTVTCDHRYCVAPMPGGRDSVKDKDKDNDQDDLVFLSPEEEFESDRTVEDQGASPTLPLRRSNRKRKSTADDMSKNSASKKKKASPGPGRDDPGRSLPRIPRTPQTQSDNHQTPGAETNGTAGTAGIEALLLAMKNRLAAKIELTSEAARKASDMAQRTNNALEDLELKVEATEVGLREDFKEVVREAEDRIRMSVQEQVRGMVDEQLRMAGFDQDLSAGDLTMRSSAVRIQGRENLSGVTAQGRSYAVAASLPMLRGVESEVLSKTERQEAKFWKARRSLRLWPVVSLDRGGVVDFLTEKLKMDRVFVEEEMGEVEVKRVRDFRGSGEAKDEAVVVFESKSVRDTIKGKAANLANYGQEVGMRLDIPDHLQKDFKLLTNLAYDMKRKNKELKRNVKFDEDEAGLFMDVLLKADGQWRRITTAQARALNSRKRRGPDGFELDELKSLVGSDEEK